MQAEVKHFTVCCASLRAHWRDLSKWDRTFVLARMARNWFEKRILPRREKSGWKATQINFTTGTLAAADNWIIFTHPLGPEKSATPPIPTGAQRILYIKGKAGKERGWWRTGTDELASYGLDTEVWISQDSTISNSNILALEALLQTKSERDLLDMRSDGVESIYWADTELGLMDIDNFPGVIYATDGSKGSTGIGAGFYQHDTKAGGCCRVGGGTGSGSSCRAEFAVACLALEDSLTHDQPIVVLTDSEGFMTVSWVLRRAGPHTNNARST